MNNNVSNGSAIYIAYCGETSIIHDSVFINNTMDDELIIDVESGSLSSVNNWFGNNATNYNIKPKVSENIAMGNWLFLNATINTTGEIKIHETSEITFKLYAYNSVSEEINEYDASKFNIKLDLSQTGGTLNQAIASINEKILYTYTEKGLASVTGKFETASYTIILAKIATTLTCADVVTVYKDTTGQLVATIVDADGNPLSVDLNVNFNGETYTVKSDSDSQITIPIGVLSCGTYVATISYAGNETHAASSTTANVVVNQADSTITGLNTSVVYKNQNNVTIATITSVYGSGMAVKVNIKLNGKEFVVKSNSKGQIRISTTDLDYGTYTAEITYKGYGKYKPSNATAQIIVTNKLETFIIAPDVSVNFSNPKGNLVATLTDVNGKALAVYVNVTFNGETYAVRQIPKVKSSFRPRT